MYSKQQLCFVDHTACQPWAQCSEENGFPHVSLAAYRITLMWEITHTTSETYTKHAPLPVQSYKATLSWVTTFVLQQTDAYMFCFVDNYYLCVWIWLLVRMLVVCGIVYSCVHNPLGWLNGAVCLIHMFGWLDDWTASCVACVYLLGQWLWWMLLAWSTC